VFAEFCLEAGLKRKWGRTLALPHSTLQARPRGRECDAGLRGESRLGLLGDLAERRDVVDRDVGQGLAVQLDVRLQQAVHEAAVAQAVHAGGGVDAHDPQRTELALALLAADIRVLGSLGDGLLGDAEDLATGVEVALRQLDDFLVATTRRYT